MASDTKPEDQPIEEKKPEQKPTALGEDDEFEDFPVDGTWTLHFRDRIQAAEADANKTYRLARGTDRGCAREWRDEAFVGRELGR